MTEIGFFVWRMEYVPHDPQELADICNQYGIKRLAFKLLEGSQTYTDHRSPSSYNVSDRALKDYFAILRANGIIVEGWGYHYPENPGAQSGAIEERRQKFGLTTYHVNIEKEWKKLWGMPSKIKTLLNGLKKGGFEVLICSYRYPTYHNLLPWNAAMNHEATDGASPQVYFLGSHNPIYQLERTFSEYAQWGKPLYPIGPVWGQNVSIGGSVVYWEPTVNDLKDFREWCELKGVSKIYWWRLGWLLQRGKYDWLEAATGVNEPPPPVPPPPPIPPTPPGSGLLMEVVQDGLRIRTGPGTEYTQIGVLEQGDVIRPTDIGGNSAWVEFEYAGGNAWANVQYGDDRNMEVYDE